MTMQTTVSNARAAFGLLRDDARDYLHARRSPLQLALSEQQQQALKDLRTNGFAVVENYWDRERALELGARLVKYLEVGGDHEFEGGAYARFWDNRKTDHGVRRIYHIERLVEELRDVRFDPFVLDIASAYYGLSFHSGMLMFQHNLQTNENTRSYHVDAFSKEFKAFIYLDDVDEGNGPFSYIPRTHRDRVRLMRKIISGRGDHAPTGFPPEELGALADTEQRICGPAGTMILADVRGLHRGTPQVERSRSVLVNYIVHTPGDLPLDR
jgi:hypothetical protein